MIIMLIFLFIITILLIMAGIERFSFEEGWFVGAFLSGILFIGFLIGTIKDYHSSNIFEKDLISVQKQADEAIEDGAQDKERAVIRGEIIKINRTLNEYQQDNKHWLWDIQISDKVDNLKPIRMISK